MEQQKAQKFLVVVKLVNHMADVWQFIGKLKVYIHQDSEVPAARVYHRDNFAHAHLTHV